MEYHHTTHYGRQPAMLPDLPALDYEHETDTSDHTREEVIRRVSLEAITQATAVAKANRALRTKTSITGQHYYREGDLVDYHRPTTTKDDWGGWNGPFPVVKNDPDRGQVIVKVGNREVRVQYPDARHTLFIEALLIREMGSDSTALRTILAYISELPAWQSAKTCAIQAGSPANDQR